MGTCAGCCDAQGRGVQSRASSRKTALEKMKLLSNPKTFHWHFDRAKSGHEESTISGASQEHEMVVFHVRPLSQLLEHDIGPCPHVSQRHVVQGDVVRVNLIVRIDEPMLG